MISFLVDCPPVLGLVDTIPIGLGCDGVVMVARIDRVTRKDLSRATKVLKRQNLIGLVANGVNSASNGHKHLKNAYQYQ